MSLLLPNGLHPSAQANCRCHACYGAGIVDHPEWRKWFIGRAEMGMAYKVPKPTVQRETLCKCTKYLTPKVHMNIRGHEILRPVDVSTHSESQSPITKTPSPLRSKDEKHS